MGPHLVEVPPPGFQLGAGVRQGAEQALVQQFVAQLAIEALAEAVLLGLSRSGVMPASPNSGRRLTFWDFDYVDALLSQRAHMNGRLGAGGSPMGV